MRRPLVTAIIPTYRRPKKLRRAINSVLNQTYPHFEIHVYDNASRDDTFEVVRELANTDCRIFYHNHASNIGSANNFNFGLKAVTTPFFSFLSDDDVILPDFYESAVIALEEHPAAAFCGATTITMTETGEVQGASIWPTERYYEPPDGLLRMIENNYLIWTGVLFRRQLSTAIGDIDAEAGAPIDIDYLLRLAAHFPFVILRRPAAIWTQHPGSSSAMTNLEFFWPGMLKTIRTLTEDEQLPISIRRQVGQSLHKQLARHLFQLGSQSIRLKHFRQAYQIATILRTEYNQHLTATLLRGIAKCCETSNHAYAFISELDRVRKLPSFRSQSNLRLLDKQYGALASFLRDSESPQPPSSTPAH